jgi:8-oxo-dGTP pyrophosphatase MutT (NUDIX family)
VAGALREAHEETGCDVRILDCRLTLVVSGRDQIVQVPLDEATNPAAVVFRRHRTPAHQPWHQQHQGDYCAIVFLAEVLGEPYPRGELPALIWLEPDMAVKCARQDIGLMALLAQGAEVVARQDARWDSSSLVRLTDSQEALILALGDDAVTFYDTVWE